MKDIKILHLYEHFLPLSQQWNFNLINQISFQNYIAAPIYSSTDLFLKWPHLKYSGMEELRIDLNYKWSVNSFIPKIKNRYQQMLGKWDKVLIKYLESIRPDIIHVHFASTAFANFDVLSNSGIPIIVSFYGWDYEAYFKNVGNGNKNIDLIFSLACVITTEGPFGRQKLIDLGADPQKIVVIPLGIITGESILRKEKLSTEKFKLIQVANYVLKKGQINTVKAFGLAMQDVPNLHLTMVGSGPEKEKIISIIEQQGLKDKITLIDHVSYKELHTFLELYDAFIHPSLTAPDGDVEGGAPTVLFDAMYAGLPIISTTHCDIPNVVRDGCNALLSSENDIEALAKNITKLAKMPKVEYDLFRQKAIYEVVSRFDIRKNVKNLETVYSDIYHKGKAY